MTDLAPTGCPDADALVRMVEGALGEESLASLEAHVDSCERCAAVIGELGAIGKDPNGASGPRHIGRYQLDRRIAAGGMGEVWAAWDPKLEREIAVKLVRPERSDDGRERERLLREARALAKLTHPNVLAVHDVGEHEGEVFLATELVPGDTLANRGGASCDWRALARLYVQAARGLAAAHGVGLVHRDVKPANLLVGPDGRVRVGDFGLAVRAHGAIDPVAPTVDGPAGRAQAVDRVPTRARGPVVTAPGHVAGTPAYMAPEQRAGAPSDARCDQFALCVALAEGIAGRRPDTDATTEQLIAFIAERRPRQAELDALCAVLVRGYARDPAARFRDMTALADAIEAIVSPDTRPDPRADDRASRGEHELARVVTRTRKRRAIGGIVAAVALAGAATAAWLGTASSQHADRASVPVTSVSPTATALPVPAPTVPAPPPPTVTAPPAPAPTVTSPIAPAPRRAPAPQQIQPAPSPAKDTADVLERAEAEIQRRDGRACATTLASAVAAQSSRRDQLRAEADRAHCKMVGGDCAAGTAMLATLYASERSVSLLISNTADYYCDADDPDPAVRRRRLLTQTERNTPDPAACDHFIKPARRFAAEATGSDKRAAAAALVSVAKCLSRNSRCDEAHALLHEADALMPGVDTPSELTADCR